MLNQKMNTTETDLTEAREILGSLKAAYREHAAGRAATRRYRIKDREMEFNSLTDLLKQIRYWVNQVARLEAAEGLKPARPQRIVTRFG